MLKRLYPHTAKTRFLVMIFSAFLLIIGIGLYLTNKQKYKAMIDSQEFILRSNYHLVTSMFDSKADQARALAAPPPEPCQKPTPVPGRPCPL